MARKQHTTTTQSSPGGPVYDARIDPANAAAVSTVADRLEQMRDIHLFGDKSAAAAVFSNTYESTPSPTVQVMMGLGQQAQIVRDAMERKNEYPFPGVHLGPVPALAASPSEPIFHNGFGHLTHHAHQVESTKRSRSRFGHG